MAGLDGPDLRGSPDPGRDAVRGLPGPQEGAALKPIYTAPNEDVARKALVEFEASELGKKYPSAAATWANSWERFIPFLQFPPMLRLHPRL